LRARTGARTRTRACGAAAGVEAGGLGVEVIGAALAEDGGAGDTLLTQGRFMGAKYGQDRFR
jgi:hypothetical protein